MHAKDLSLLLPYCPLYFDSEALSVSLYGCCRVLKLFTAKGELDKTRLAIASILGPFRVHQLKFTLDTHPGSLMHYLGYLEFPVIICDALHIATHTGRT